MFLSCQMWDRDRGAVVPGACVVAPAHAVLVHDFPLRDQLGTVYALVLVRLVSGENALIVSTPEVRAAFGLPAFDVLTLPLLKAPAVQQ